MRATMLLFVATLFLGLANPAIAQTDPHHPEGADAPTTAIEAPVDETAHLPTPAAGNATTQCPDMMGMMGMMQQGGANAMPMMQMHMMGMMQIHMQLMQQMQSGGTMQPGTGGSPQMQMMAMMQSMRAMQMDMMQMMQQMRRDMPATEAPAERGMP